MKDLFEVVLYHHVQGVIRTGGGQFWLVIFVKEERIQLQANISVVFVQLLNLIIVKCEPQSSIGETSLELVTVVQLHYLGILLKLTH